MSEDKNKEKKEAKWGDRDPNPQETATFESEKKEIKWGERDPKLTHEARNTREDKDE